MPPYASVPWSATLRRRVLHRCPNLRALSSDVTIGLQSGIQVRQPIARVCAGRHTLPVRHASVVADRDSYPSETDFSETEGFQEKTDLDSLRRAHSLLSTPISSTGFRNEAISRPGNHVGVEGKGSPTVEDLISAGHELLNPTEPAKKLVRLAIYGPDTPLSVRALVTALLDDPLSSDEHLRRSLWDRWSDLDGWEYLNIEHATSTLRRDDRLAIRSPFLLRFGVPVSVTEFCCPQNTQKHPAIAKLLSAEIPVLVRTLGLMCTSGKFLLANPNAIVVLDTPLDPASKVGKLVLDRVAEEHGLSPSRIVFVDIEQALRGTSAFRSSVQRSASQQAEAVRQYQTDVLGSRIPTLILALESIVKRGINLLQADARSALKVHMLDTARGTARAAKLEASYARERVCTLRAGVLEEKARSLTAVLGSDNSVLMNEGANHKGEPMKGPFATGIMRASNFVRPTIDTFSWWRLPFVVDDISMRVDHAVEKAFARSFEHELVFHTGRLAALQLRLLDDTNALLASLPPTFQSRVLQNTLEQISGAPSFLIMTPTPSPSESTDSNSRSSSAALAPTPVDVLEAGLVVPVRYRTGQLAHATRALHLKAQRCLLAAYGALLLSASGAAGSVVVLHSLDGATAAAAGALSALIGVHWAVGSWERARKAWWRDFFRVGEGLERDIWRVLNEMLDRHVCVIPEEACKGLTELINRREEQIGHFENEVDRVENTPKDSKKMEERTLNCSQKSEETPTTSSL